MMSGTGVGTWLSVGLIAWSVPLLLGCRGGETEYREVLVNGPSMSPTLVGPGWDWRCGACGIPFRIAKLDAAPRHVICTNCGHTTAFDASRLQLGATTWFDEKAYRHTVPRRDEIVALRQPGDRYLIKRLVGLPGESIRIAEGDLWIDGTRLQKNWNQFLARAVLVYDDRYRSAGSERFRGGPDSSSADGVYRFAEVPTTSEWLIYHHYSPHATQGPTEESAILDDYVENQTVRRSLHPVRDIGITMSVDLTAGSLDVAIWNGDRAAVARFEGPCQHSLGAAWLDGRLVASRPFQRLTVAENAPPVDENRPIAIRKRGQGQLAISELRVLRDLHYLGPGGREADWMTPKPLAENRFFVLGDNVPVSSDSRDAPGGLPAEQLIGRIIERRNQPAASGGAAAHRSMQPPAAP